MSSESTTISVYQAIGINGAIDTPSNVLDFRPCVITPPKEGDGFVTIRIKRFFDEETKRINSHVLKEARVGFVYEKQITTCAES